MDHRELIDTLQLVRRLLLNQRECHHSLCSGCNESRTHMMELLDFVLAGEPASTVMKAATHADYLGG